MASILLFLWTGARRASVITDPLYPRNRYRLRVRFGDACDLNMVPARWRISSQPHRFLPPVSETANAANALSRIRTRSACLISAITITVDEVYALFSRSYCSNVTRARFVPARQPSAPRPFVARRTLPAYRCLLESCALESTTRGAVRPWDRFAMLCGQERNRRGSRRREES